MIEYGFETDPMVWTYLGVDPGKSGSVSFIRVSAQKVEIESYDMPGTPEGLWGLVRDCRATSTILEEVRGHIGKQQSGDHMFKFGSNYGQALMALVASGNSPILARPQEWMKGLGIPSKRKAFPDLDEIPDHVWKRFLRDWAEKLYPNYSITVGVADSVLIAHYARELYEKTHTTVNQKGWLFD